MIEPYTPVANLPPFPFNLVSRVWHRIWDGITLPCQKAYTPSSPSPGFSTSTKLTRFPFRPPPTSTSAPTRDSSPSCRPVCYNGISSLLDVDYLRGGVSHKRSSQSSDWASLRVLNPDYTDMQSSAAPDCLEGPLIRSPNTPTAASTGLGFDTPRASLASKSQSSVSAGNVQPPTEDETLESFLLRRLKERPRSSRTTPLPRNGLTHALDLFTSKSIPGPPDTGTLLNDGESESINTDAIPSPRPRLPSFGSSLGAPFGLDQFRREWLQSSPYPQSEEGFGAVYSQTEGATLNSGSRSGWETRSRSPGSRSGALHRCSSNTSPSLLFMSEVFHQRRPGIFVSLGNMGSFGVTLTTGTVAQRRRLGEKQR